MGLEVGVVLVTPVEGVARVRHLDVVALRGYYYAREEKLFATNFVRNKNLHTALHGSFSRSAVNHESGAKSSVSGIVSGIIMTCALLFLTPLFEYVYLRSKERQRAQQT